MMVVVVFFSTIELGRLIVFEYFTLQPFAFNIHGLLNIFGYFLLILIGVELLETIKAYLSKRVMPALPV